MSNVPAVIEKTITNLISAQASASHVTSGDFQYLKLSKSGDWVFGADETEVSDSSVFVIDPDSYSQGFVAWDDGELVDEKMSNAGQPPITAADLETPAGAKWDAQVAFALKCIEGAEEGVQLLYKTSSRGGKSAVAELLAKIIERGKAGESSICPVVLLDTSSYKHKKYGKIFTPILSVDEWVNLPDAANDADAVKPEPEPKKITKKEPETAATKRTRRKRNTA